MKAVRDEKAAVDAYIAAYPPAVRAKLTQLRRAIRKAAPGAIERISYRMPAFDLNGILVWIGGHDRHLGLYPTAEGVRAFESELGRYVHSKGAIQLPLDEALPLGLVTRIVKHRVKRNVEKAKTKSAAKPPARRR